MDCSLQSQGSRDIKPEAEEDMRCATRMKMTRIGV